MDQKISLGLFFQWLFVYSTARVARMWLFFLTFMLRLFSVPRLLKTFFAPWHRYWFGYPRAFNPREMFLALFGNVISRVVGMVLRLCVIALGLVCEAVVFVVGFVFVAAWIALPFVSVYFFYTGWRMIF